MNSHTIATALASNRAEELGFDVWDRFVIPPKLDIAAWADTRKPRVIVGGRGCGKTMLLRYLSHDSAFSPNRPAITPSSLNHIGIYWRADTQFASLLDARDQSDAIWTTAFGHFSTLLIGKELLRAIQSVAESGLPLLDTADLSLLDFSNLSGTRHPIPGPYNEFLAYLDTQLRDFEYWVSNIDAHERPIFFPTPNILRRMVSTVLSQLPALRSMVFYVYTDEYENLTHLQQKVINTWMKHSEPPLIFNLAMKRKGFKTRQTLGEETLSEIRLSVS